MVKNVSKNSSIMKIEQLRKSFITDNNKTEVIKGVSFDIKEGEFVSIMGPSGSGKSTLLYILGAIDQPSSGVISVNNKNIAQMNDKELSKLRRSFYGFIFQSYNLIGNLNVEDNILLPIMFDKKNPADYREKAREYIEVVGLGGKEKKKSTSLSGGEQQRVGIARALINDPKIILADEATGNLDSKAGKSIMELFKRINEQYGITIIQVTHSEELATYGNRIIRMKDGVILDDVR